MNALKKNDETNITYFPKKIYLSANKWNHDFNYLKTVHNSYLSKFESIAYLSTCKCLLPDVINY